MLSVNRYPKRFFNFFVLIYFFFVLIFNSCHPGNSKKILAINGIMDLGKFIFNSHSVVNLDGEWGFEWKNLTLELNYDNPKSKIIVPSTWNKQNGKSEIEKEGYGTYYLKISLPKGSHRLGLLIPPINSTSKIFINEKIIFESGRLGNSFEEEEPVEISNVKFFDIENEIRLVIQTSNFHHRTGGIRKEFILGSEESISNWQKREIYTDFYLIGCLSIIGIYHIILFLLRKKDLYPFYFSLLCLDIAFRTFLTGQMYFTQFFPSVSWEIIKKLEYFTFYAGPIFLILFLSSAFPNEISKKIKKLIIPTSILFIISLIPSAKVYTKFLVYFQILSGIFILYTLYCLIIAYRKRREGAKSILLGMSIFFLTILNDILNNRGIIHTPVLNHWGLFIFIFSQSYVIAFRFSNAFYRAETLTDNLLKTNVAYSRFVPSEFLNYLNKQSIMDINLGDQMQREMTIFFSDIRSFTKLSESMSPEENFNFLNSYLKRVGPIIRKYKGFIDKYIGDGIMALFPNDPVDAINCAVEMQEEIRKYNNFRVKSNYDPIRVGIGIHMGNIILGTIGENERMEGSVISDAVNLASRLEGLTKFYGSYILISEDLIKKIDNKNDYKYRKLGRVRVKGKKEAVGVVEILNGQPAFLLDLFESTKSDFSNGLNSYMLKEFDRAAFYFQKVLSTNNMDSTAKLYLGRSEKYSYHGVDKDWDGVEEMEIK